MDGLVEYSIDDCIFCSCFCFPVLCSVSGLVVCAICAERIYEEEGAGGGKGHWKHTSVTGNVSALVDSLTQSMRVCVKSDPGENRAGS